MNDDEMIDHQRRMLAHCRQQVSVINPEDLTDLINRIQNHIAKTPPLMRNKSSHCQLLLEAANMLRKFQ
jgi:hypothetical protein